MQPEEGWPDVDGQQNDFMNFMPNPDGMLDVQPPSLVGMQAQMNTMM